MEMFRKKHLWFTIKKDLHKLKSFVEKYRSDLINRVLDYLINCKWQGSNMYCTPKVRKIKSIQEMIAISNDNYIEAFQPEDLKVRPITSVPQSLTQHLSFL